MKRKGKSDHVPPSDLHVLGRRNRVRRESSSSVNSEIFDIVTAFDSANEEKQIELLIQAAQFLVQSNTINPDKRVIVGLAIIAKKNPYIFRHERIYPQYVQLLGTSSKSPKKSSIIAEFGANLLWNTFRDIDISSGYSWPLSFFGAYIEDTVGERLWVDSRNCQAFVANIETAIPSLANYSYQQRTQQRASNIGGNISTLSTPVTSESESSDAESSSGREGGGSGERLDYKRALENKQNGNGNDILNENLVSHRYSEEVQNQAIDYVIDVLKHRPSGSGGAAATTSKQSDKRMMGLLLQLVNIPQIREFASQRIDNWVNNPSTNRKAMELLSEICRNTCHNEGSDQQVLHNIFNMRAKQHQKEYSQCLTTLIYNDPSNIGHEALRHFIFREAHSHAYNLTDKTTAKITASVVSALRECNLAENILGHIFFEMTLTPEYRRSLHSFLAKFARSTSFDLLKFAQELMRIYPQSLSNQPTEEKEAWFYVMASIICSACISAAALNEPKNEDSIPEWIKSFSFRIKDIIFSAVEWCVTIAINYFSEISQDRFLGMLYFVLFLSPPESYNMIDLEKNKFERYFGHIPIDDKTMITIIHMCSVSVPHLVPKTVLLDTLYRLVYRAARFGKEMNVEHGIAIASSQAHSSTREYFDAIFNQAVYMPPIQNLPEAYSQHIFLQEYFWQACEMIVIMSVHNPKERGWEAWQIPFLRSAMEYLTVGCPDDYDSTYSFFNMGSRDREMIIEFGQYMITRNYEQSLGIDVFQQESIDNWLKMFLVYPPQDSQLEQFVTSRLTRLKDLDEKLDLGNLLRSSRDPDFLHHVIQRHGTRKALTWLSSTLSNSPATLNLLPVTALCELFLSDPQGRVFPDIHPRIVSRLSELLLNATTEDQSLLVLAFFMERIPLPSSSHASYSALNTLLNQDVAYTPEDEIMAVDDVPSSSEKEQDWLTKISHLSCWPQATSIVWNSLTSALQSLSHIDLLSSLVEFLIRHKEDLTELPWDLTEQLSLFLLNRQRVAEKTFKQSYVYNLVSKEYYQLLVHGIDASDSNQSIDIFPVTLTNEKTIQLPLNSLRGILHFISIPDIPSPEPELVSLLFKPSKTGDPFTGESAAIESTPLVIAVDKADRPYDIAERFLKSHSQILFEHGARVLPQNRILDMLIEFGLSAKSLETLIRRILSYPSFSWDQVPTQQCRVIRDHMNAIITSISASNDQAEVFLKQTIEQLLSKMPSDYADHSLEERNQPTLESIDYIFQDESSSTHFMEDSTSSKMQPRYQKASPDKISNLDDASKVIVEIIREEKQVKNEKAKSIFDTVCRNSKATVLLNCNDEQWKTILNPPLQTEDSAIHLFGSILHDPHHRQQIVETITSTMNDLNQVSSRIRRLITFYTEQKRESDIHNIPQPMATETNDSSAQDQQTIDITTDIQQSVAQGSSRSERQLRRYLNRSGNVIGVEDVLNLIGDRKYSSGITVDTISQMDPSSLGHLLLDSIHPHRPRRVASHLELTLLDLVFDTASRSQLRRMCDRVLAEEHVVWRDHGAIALQLLNGFYTMDRERQRRYFASDPWAPGAYRFTPETIRSLVWLISRFASISPVPQRRQESIERYLDLLLDAVAQNKSNMKSAVVTLQLMDEDEMKAKHDLLAILYLSFPQSIAWLPSQNASTIHADAILKSPLNPKLGDLIHRLCQTLLHGKRKKHATYAFTLGKDIAMTHPQVWLRHFRNLAAITEHMAGLSVSDSVNRGIVTRFTRIAAWMDALRPYIFYHPVSRPLLPSIMERLALPLQHATAQDKALLPLAQTLLIFVTHAVSSGNAAVLITPTTIDVFRHIADIWTDMRTTIQRVLEMLSPSILETGTKALEMISTESWQIDGFFTQEKLDRFTRELQSESPIEALVELEQIAESTTLISSASILHLFAADMTELMKHENRTVRTVALKLSLRILEDVSNAPRRPRIIETLIPSFLAALTHDSPDIRRTAAQIAADVFPYAQDYKQEILTQLFNLGKEGLNSLKTIFTNSSIL
eukprot:gb/GECH01009251.1/.p1 GENE.gb/GECH01009251.1/~~gb/GECH01009251.1/.p1  ORF type:complete len:2010 (+),score=462.52 gb/GECH01009251.1/:1-6030(+)